MGDNAAAGGMLHHVIKPRQNRTTDRSRRHEVCEIANGEDLHLLPTLQQIAGGRPGVFVEIGAYNGIHLFQSLRTPVAASTGRDCSSSQPKHVPHAGLREEEGLQGCSNLALERVAFEGVYKSGDRWRRYVELTGADVRREP